MSNKKLRLKRDIGESVPSRMTPSAPIPFLENKVRFSFRDCNKDKFCVRKLSNDEIDKFYTRLGYLENLKWQQVKQISRENGISIEKKDSENHEKLSELYSEFSVFGHFRVNGTGNPFRVFGAQKEDLFYVLLIDKDGLINESAHK